MTVERWQRVLEDLRTHRGEGWWTPSFPLIENPTEREVKRILSIKEREANLTVAADHLFGPILRDIKNIVFAGNAQIVYEDLPSENISESRSRGYDHYVRGLQPYVTVDTSLSFRTRLHPREPLFVMEFSDKSSDESFRKVKLSFRDRSKTFYYQRPAQEFVSKVTDYLEENIRAAFGIAKSRSF